MSVDQPKYCRYGKFAYCSDRFEKYKCLVPAARSAARSRLMWVSSYDTYMKYCGRELSIAVHGRLDHDNIEMSLFAISHYAEMFYNPYQVIGKCKIRTKRMLTHKHIN